MSEKATELDLTELKEAWGLLSADERLAGFRLLSEDEQEEFFFELSARDQYELLLMLLVPQRRLWLRLLAPDDAADVVQEADEEERPDLLGLLDEPTRREVSALLAYEEDEAGGLMSSRFARLRADMTVDEALSYLRRQALSHVDFETIYYVYVLDQEQRLLGVVSFRELFSELGSRLVRDIMNTEPVTVPEELDQEAVARVMADNDIVAVPVVDHDNRMVGIVTVDDIVDVVEEEATEDVQKFGGMQALEEPYLRTTFVELIKKRVGWLTLLLIGEMATAPVIAAYEEDVHARAGFLMTFIPLIISSGGNSGSQASTLVVRAMTLGELRLRDWWRVMRRELAAGLTLGTILGAIGMFRVYAWHMLWPQAYEPLTMGVTIFVSLLGVVMFGTLAGSMLPLLLRKAKFDPASASAPMVATVVDVMGLVIYFTVASLLILG